MFKKIIVLTIFFTFLSQSGLATEYFNIPHVAEENWMTTITVYNVGNEEATVSLYHWDNSGILTGNTDHNVSPKGYIELKSDTFGFNGIAQLQAEDNSEIRVKLSYLYLGSEHSESLCEFFINKEEVGRNWFIPNPYQEHFHWFGLAFANHGEEAVNLTLTAYKDGAQVGQSNLSVDPKEKEVGISSAIWDGLNYEDIQMVSIEADMDICPPISITGNTSQSRHVFFSGTPHKTEGSIYNYQIPHVPDGDWLTTLTAYSLIPDERGTLSLSAYDKDGNLGEYGTYRVGPYTFKEFSTESEHLVKGGTATIKSYSPLFFKLSYRYGSRESICDFILTTTKSKKWLLTNTFNSWFDWFGIAFANLLDTNMDITVTAFKNNSQVAQDSHTLLPYLKKVDLVDGFFSEHSLGYSDVDMVLIESSQPMGNPVSITGNNGQDRHVFFKGQDLQKNIYFEDLNFKDYMVENFDTNGDGEISYEEAELITEIDTPGMYNSQGNITNLEGIQYCTGLNYLTVEYEALESIPDISNLIHLKGMNLSYNPLTMLPDLTHLNELRALNINLTEIEHLENLPASLEELYCDFTAVTNIDLTGLALLYTLRCSDSPVETITGTAGLESLTTLYAQRCNLTELNLSGCTALKRLRIINNQIVTLNVTGCSSLEELKAEENLISTLNGLNDCNALIFLFLNNNSLTSLTITDKSNLKGIRLHFNNLTSVTLSELPSLDELNLLDNPLTELDVSSLSALETLNCAKTELTLLDISGLSSLEKVEAYQTQLNSIDFSGCNSLAFLNISTCMFDDIPDVTSLPAIDIYFVNYNYFGEDDCPVVQSIEAMGLTTFIYNNQYDNTTLICP